jgi:hypothetical protein
MVTRIGAATRPSPNKSQMGRPAPGRQPFRCDSDGWLAELLQVWVGCGAANFAISDQPLNSHSGLPSSVRTSTSSRKARLAW